MAASALAQAAGFWAKAVARHDADAAKDEGAPPPPRGSVATERGVSRGPSRGARPSSASACPDRVLGGAD
eukprot:5308699-Lingulodinium_polyedra.AAC.1